MLSKLYFAVLAGSFIAVCAVAFYYLKSEAQVDTETITLSTDVQTAIALVVSSNTYAFGNLVSGAPEKGSAGIDADVTTNASNGYTLGISDSVAGGNSCLLHTDAATRIIDYASTIALPTLWNSGTDRGLGATVYAADTTKELKWGGGSAYDDVLNKYAGVPQTATTIHTSAGFKTGADTSSVAFIVDVNADQKSGVYSGNVTLTATAVLI